MFKKILIANRGEIACRVAATARRMGIRTVAVFSDADHQAAHVLACDEAVHIGGSAPAESYLRTEALLQAARATGAEAVHPGYGFLSENEAFASACAAAGLTFIGPPPSALRAMGLKAESKRLMAAAGVPLVPGYHGADQDPARLQREADAIGYPVLIKASAGGGGKGMRVVDSADAFAAALAACQREARHSFGNDAVLIERCVPQPRHIEIQVFGDTHGHCVHLHERDCSVQRRHQKVLEEAPAPGMSPERRAQMGAAAVAAARAVAYVGAGTVEFITEQDGRFYFMEMNTRLQVEHPVTEAITGLDLVEWQLRVAAGEPLPLTQAEIPLRGHAIEARLCAENPDANFLPATGRLAVFQVPAAATRFEPGALRLDAGVREGDTITPFYDPMIGKLIAWGRDRAEALARLDAALAATHIVGPHHNVGFLRRVLASGSFAQARLDTGLIERERDTLFHTPGLAVEWAAAGVLAQQRVAEQALQTADPWSRRDGWRLHGEASRQLLLATADGHTHTVGVHGSPSGVQRLSCGEGSWPLSCSHAGGAVHDVRLGAHSRRLSVYAGADRWDVFSAEGHCTLHRVDPLAQATDAATEGRLSAPMPGKVVAFLVRPGEAVTRGQAVAVMEAMKMEHTLTAPRDGVVQAWSYAVGEQVGEGNALLSLVPLD